MTAHDRTSTGDRPPAPEIPSAPPSSVSSRVPPPRPGAGATPDPSSLPPLPAPRARSRARKVIIRLLAMAAGVAGLAAVVALGLVPYWGRPAGADTPLTVPVGRGTLRIVVTERGNLESVKTVDGVCDLAGFQNKI